MFCLAPRTRREMKHSKKKIRKRTPEREKMLVFGDEKESSAFVGRIKIQVAKFTQGQKNWTPNTTGVGRPEAA